MTTRPGFISPPVWELQKRDVRLVAGAREYKGRQFFELRYWAGEHGDKATAKGVTMPLASVDSLAKALTAYVEGKSLNEPEGGPQG